MNLKYLLMHNKKPWIALFVLLTSFLVAQSNPALEMADGDSNPTTNVTSVVQNTTIRLRKNTDNATGNTFATYANPSALTVSYSLSNQQYTQANFTGYNGAVFMGYTNEPVLTLMNAFGNTSAASFTSSGGAAVGTGIDIAVNRAVNFLANVQPLSAAGRATNQRWQMADLTLTFNRPVTNPYLQINALGGATNTIYYTTEMDYVSSNVPVTFSKVSGNATLNVTSTQILNNATVPDATLANSARGTVLVTGTGITTLVLRVYIRGAAANTGTNWHATSNTSGEGFMVGVTVAESNLQVTQTASTTTPTVGSNVTFTINASNLGASNNTGVVVTDALPPGFTFVSATPSVGTYNPATGVWTIGALNDGATATMTLVGTMTRNGAYLNTATISGAVTDPSAANNTSTTQVLSPDVDNDGILNAADLDNDNDGILNTVEGCSATVTMASVTTTTVNNLSTNSTAVFPLVPPGTTLPNGGVTITRTAGTGNTWGVFTPPVATTAMTVNGTQSSSFPTTYLDLTGTIPRTININFGVTANSLSTANNQYQFVIGIAGMGGENTSVTNTFSVPLTVASNSNVFNTNLYSLLNGSPSTTPGVSGTVFTTNTPLTTAQGYTFFLVPVDVATFNMTLTGGNDPHGIIFGVYNANCTTDTDGDGIPNYLDPDSDNDGCPDAIEGTEQVQFNQVHPLVLPTTDPNYPFRGQIKVTYNGVTAATPAQSISTSAAANGVPQLVNNAGNNLNATTNPTNLAGVADNTDIPTPTTADVGQGIGNSQNSGATDVECSRCFRPATSPGVGGLPTNHGITALGRAGATNGNWPMKITGAYTALDAKTKGFVINRMPTTQLASITAVVGMMVYDTTENCLKIYDNSGTWRCYNTQTCDNFNQ